jgi:hypothetical protein
VISENDANVKLNAKGLECVALFDRRRVFRGVFGLQWCLALWVSSGPLGGGGGGCSLEYRNPLKSHDERPTYRFSSTGVRHPHMKDALPTLAP